MPAKTDNPPRKNGLDIAAFSRLFDNTTTSYKFLWMLGILKITEESEDELRIPTHRIVAHMLELARQPIIVFRLFLGAEDKMHKHLEKISCAELDTSIQTLKNIPECDKKQKALSAVSKDLTRFVPQQILTPFFVNEVKKYTKSDKRAEAIRYLANKRFHDKNNPPPYRMELSPSPNEIELHPKWRDYFIRNREIIRGWTMYHWIDFLQARNPYVPSIVNKIIRPETREQQTQERRWWRAIIRHVGGMHCIYSGKTINASDSFVLDHFIPWSFVGHNRLWNLIPANENANLRKSNSLPNMEKYYDQFINTQYRALKANAALKRNSKIINAYTEDLKITLPPTRKNLHTAYDTVIPPLITLAKNQGFASDWDFKNTPAEDSRGMFDL